MSGKSKRRSTPVLQKSEPGSMKKATGKKVVAPIRNPVAANPLLGKSVQHDNRQQRKRSERTSNRQALRKQVDGHNNQRFDRAGNGGGDDWQSGKQNSVVLPAALPVVSTAFAFAVVDLSADSSITALSGNIRKVGNASCAAACG